MNHTQFAKSALTAAFCALLGQSSLSLAANAGMQQKSYFDPGLYAERNKPTHPISDYRYQLNIASLSRGLGEQTVPLLGAAPGPGKSEVMKSLLDKLGGLDLGTKVGAGKVVREDSNNKRLAAYGDGWKLKVYGDGSRVQFRHYGFMDQNEAAMAKLPRMEPEELVEVGRVFINDYLGRHIHLAKGEELVPFGVQYQINAQQSADGRGKAQETTVAAAVIFSRKINGVDVLGKGSKVAVLYANNGTPFGFDYDWPELYPLGADQQTAPLKELQQRSLEVAKLADNALNPRLEHFECGYYDAGQSKRGDAPMQPACFHFYSAQSKGETEDGAQGLLSMAFVDPIPAGTEIIPDENWDTALELLYGPAAVPERAKPGTQSKIRADMRAALPSGKEAMY